MGNPFFNDSQLELRYPPFGEIAAEHYLPAFERGMAEELTEMEAIATQSADATFDNTIVAMEESGQLLNRVRPVFFNLASAHTDDELEAIRSDLAPKLAAHRDRILLNQSLFERIQRLHTERDNLRLDDESKRLIEEYQREFVRAGACLSAADKERLSAKNAEIARLQTAFSQNVLKEVNESAIVVDSRQELAGCPDAFLESAAEEAGERDLDGKYVIPLLNTSGQPALAFLANRDLRERIHSASLSRGSRGGDFDNRDILSQIVRLRAERAQLLGYETHAEYVLEDETAGTVDAVNQRLAELTRAAVANARHEADALQQMIETEGESFPLAPWDWDYYSEKVRSARFDFDAAQLRPYFELNSVLHNGVFHAASCLYGLSFKERTDLPVYQEDVRVFEVADNDGTLLALFLADFYARPSKRGGAWMSAYVSQSDLMNTRAIVANHLNIPKPAQGEATLLTFDEVTTMFHEFGHALHGMFSKVRYPFFSGTSVPRDFVEFPSQVNEMWAMWPEVLKNYTRHHETGAPMPAALLDKVLAARRFNQGFATTEYLAAALLDQALHQLQPHQVPDAEGLLEFEAAALAKAGAALSEVPPRYRSAYFSHIVGGYAAGYYSYIWAEVLDADTVDWFADNGGLKRENGDHFRSIVLSRGGSEHAMTLYRRFRGAEPNIAPLLKRRGLE
jgi:peptidyl-dipeptidase Dcp|tara:strand:+ start:39122 stop:41161 length:2040 start_codon:yes stop_codon:yes gene_type:complete